MVKTGADLVSSVLRRCGELTDGTSPFLQQAIDYLNQIHNTVLVGGSEFDIDVDEPWIWARSPNPLIIELQPPYDTGSVALTQGSASGTFSAAPTISLEGYFLRLDSGPEAYKIVHHTANNTAFKIDAAFTQDSVTAGTYTAYLLDYQLVASYIAVNGDNNSLDFIETGSTVRTATLTHGSYTPAQLATQVATALNAATVTGNTYSASYDSIKRLFSVTSALNGTGSPVFKPQGAGTNSYRSGWETLGFDFTNYDSAATQTGTYPLSAVVRLTEPARCYYSGGYSYGNPFGQIAGVDALTMDKDFPLARVQAGVPTAFCIIKEKNDGTVTVRFNKFPDKKVRVEFEAIHYPKDLQNNTASIPLFPRKFLPILEYGACYYLLKDKNDRKAETYFSLTQMRLKSMITFNRKELLRIGRNFGNVPARPDLMSDTKRYRLNIYGYDSGVF